MNQFSTPGEAKVVFVGDAAMLAIANETKESLVIDLTVEQLRTLVIEAAEILSLIPGAGVDRTKYSDGGIQYTVTK
jgi:hypothetical protein